MHLHQCSAPEMRRLRSLSIGEVEDAVQERHVLPALWQAMKKWMLEYCSGDSDIPPPTGRALEAYEAQSKIGWDQFMKGRVASLWGEIMRDRYATTAKWRRVESRKRFVTSLIDSLWKVSEALWSHQCTKVHDETDLDSLAITELDARVKYYFAQRTKSFDSGDYDRFHMGLDNTWALHPPQKRAWLHTLSYRLIATERARARLHNKIRPITAYFDCIPQTDMASAGAKS